MNFLKTTMIRLVHLTDSRPDFCCDKKREVQDTISDFNGDIEYSYHEDNEKEGRDDGFGLMFYMEGLGDVLVSFSSSSRGPMDMFYYKIIYGDLNISGKFPSAWTKSLRELREEFLDWYIENLD